MLEYSALQVKSEALEHPLDLTTRRPVETLRGWVLWNGGGGGQMAGLEGRGGSLGNNMCAQVFQECGHEGELETDVGWREGSGFLSKIAKTTACLFAAEREGEVEDGGREQ